MYVIFCMHGFSKMYFRNNLIKNWTVWSHIHTCFPLQPFTKNSSILNPHFHFKFSILCFITSKRVKEFGIPDKDHLFQASLFALILFSVSKTCVYFEDTFLERVWTHLKMHLWYLFMFIFSALFTEFALIECFVVIVFIIYGAPIWNQQLNR